MFYKQQSSTSNTHTSVLIWDSKYDVRPAKRSIIIMNTISVPCVTFVERMPWL